MIVTLTMDLTGSKLGPAWRSVECEVQVKPTYEPLMLRRSAAAHYGIPVDQVGEPILSAESFRKGPPNER